ncbi:MAG: hypothetical protein GXY32_07130 [Ruminococcaceae bacterium]|nr:hypothetical protein [Oscillospiraceae bacterium]
MAYMAQPVQAAAPVSYPPPAPAAPAAQPRQAMAAGGGKPPKGSPYAVVGAWAFVGYAIVMAIPLVGFIVAIVWAASSSGPLNRRNYARAMLLLWVLALVIAVLCVALSWAGLLQFVNFNFNYSW